MLNWCLNPRPAASRVIEGYPIEGDRAQSAAVGATSRARASQPFRCPPPFNPDAARVRDRMVHPADLRPALGNLEERLLDEVLGLGQVPDDQIRRAQEPVAVLGDEAVEVCAARSAHASGILELIAISI